MGTELMKMIVPVGSALAGVVLGFMLNVFYRRWAGQLRADLVEFKIAQDQSASRLEFTVKVLLHNSKEIPLALLRPHIVLLDSKRTKLIRKLLCEVKNDGRTGQQVVKIGPFRSEHHHWSAQLADAGEIDATMTRARSARIEATRPGGKKPFRLDLGKVKDALQ